MNGTIKIEDGELRIEVRDLIDGLSADAKKQVAKLIGADEYAWRQMAEAIADPSGFYNKEDGFGDWWFSRETMLQVREKLRPLMPEVARLAVEAALKQRDEAISNGERHQRWAWDMWHAHKGFDRRPFPNLPEWAPAAREELRKRDAADAMLKALVDLEHEAFNLPHTETLGPEHPFEEARRAAQRAIALATEEPREFAGLSLVPPAPPEEQPDDDPNGAIGGAA